MASKFYKYFTLLLFLFIFICDANGESIECPIPGNPSTVSEVECIYSACRYSNGACVMEENDAAGYYISGSPQHTTRGLKVPLTKANLDSTLFNDDVTDLSLEFIRHENYHLQVKIFDPSRKRYEVPYDLNVPDTPSDDPLYAVSTSSVGEPFFISVSRSSNSVPIFETVGPLTFEDQFIQFTVRLPSEYLYGLGENYHTNLKQSFDTRSTYPIFARDRNTLNPGEYNHYGSHPYYVSVENDEGDTHSVLLYSSNAIEYSTFQLMDGSPAITFRILGGIIDLHLFFGPKPEDVCVQYATAVGKPNLPPYWAFGFTLSRWNYGSTQNYRTIRQRMKDAQIPMDVQTFDIDYMDERKDFTFDPINWFDLPQLIQELHSENVKVTLILDPAIAIDWDTYPPSQRGKERNVYIRWEYPDLVPDDQPEGAETFLVGRVWPVNRTVFPDFLKPDTQDWWRKEIEIFHDLVCFDALWIDMNEPSNFGTNTPGSLQCPHNKWDSPPYPTLAAWNDENFTNRISDGTICMSTNQTTGVTQEVTDGVTSVTQFRHYDVHNLYGFSETIATYNSLESLFPGKRKAVLTRSTFPGSGHFGIHWLGDNSAEWEQMELSIIGMLEFNMFAMPMVGADICGFMGEPSMELCARWMQLGAFYPYSRNHNTDTTADQDPAVWPTVAKISRQVLLMRYKYLPFLYSLFHESHWKGSTVVRALFHVFPRDLNSRLVQDQFLWGDSLMIAPIITQGAIAREVYFPKSLWYRLDTGFLISTGAETLWIEAPLEYIPVYVRGGAILPFQEPDVTTTLSRLNDFGFVVSLDETESAEGYVTWDDGETDVPSSSVFYAVTSFGENTFQTTIKRNPKVAEGLQVSTLTFLGVSFEPSSVQMTYNDTSSLVPWVYNSEFKILNITSGLHFPLNQPVAIRFI